MKNHLKLLPLIAVMFAISGCSSTILKKDIPNVQNNEDALVGMSVAEQLSKTDKELKDQLALLQLVNSGKTIESYNLVTHNHNLDARAGSNNTVPINYAIQDVPVSSGSSQSPTITQTQTVQTVTQQIQEPDTASLNAANAMQQRVKKIVWKEDSLNTLAKNLSKNIGFDLVIKPAPNGIGDANISYFVENVTLKEAVEELKRKAAPVADILIFEQNRTVNVLYK